MNDSVWRGSLFETRQCQDPTSETRLGTRTDPKMLSSCQFPPKARVLAAAQSWQIRTAPSIMESLLVNGDRAEWPCSPSTGAATDLGFVSTLSRTDTYALSGNFFFFFFFFFFLVSSYNVRAVTAPSLR